MNESPDELDRALRARFDAAHASLAPDAFVRETRRRIAEASARRRRTRRVMQGAALAALVLASPWLIEGSRRAAEPIDAWLSVATGWLMTPLGIVAVAVVALVAKTVHRVIRSG